MYLLNQNLITCLPQVILACMTGNNHFIIQISDTSVLGYVISLIFVRGVADYHVLLKSFILMANSGCKLLQLPSHRHIVVINCSSETTLPLMCSLNSNEYCAAPQMLQLHCYLHMLIRMHCITSVCACIISVHNVIITSPYLLSRYSTFDTTQQYKITEFKQCLWVPYTF